jgi:hypothetical protein
VKVFSTDSGEVLHHFKMKRTISDMKFSSSIGGGISALTTSSRILLLGLQAKDDQQLGGDGRFIVCGGQGKLSQLVDLELSVWPSSEHFSFFNSYWLARTVAGRKCSERQTQPRRAHLRQGY